VASKSIEVAVSKTLGICKHFSDRFSEKVLHSLGCRLPPAVLAAAVVCFDLPRLLDPDRKLPQVPMKELRVLSTWAHLRLSRILEFPAFEDLVQQYQDLLSHWRDKVVATWDLFWTLRCATTKFPNGGKAVVPASWLAISRRAVPTPLTLGSSSVMRCFIQLVA